MAKLSDDEVVFFQETNSLETNEGGRRVLRGLTFRETEEYLVYWRKQLRDSTGLEIEPRQRFLQLHRKHLGALRPDALSR
jgi:hypothetical protein